MAFFTSAIGTLKVLVIALGAGLGVWGVMNLLKGYGNDNPGMPMYGREIDLSNFVRQPPRYSECAAKTDRNGKDRLSVRFVPLTKWQDCLTRENTINFQIKPCNSSLYDV